MTSFIYNIFVFLIFSNKKNSKRFSANVKEQTYTHLVLNAFQNKLKYLAS